MFQNLLLLSFSFFLASPLSLQWDNKYNTIPEIEDYQYYYGSIPWGQVIYIGTEDILGMESEVQLFFEKKRITKANLILGPSGINSVNCVKKFTKVRELLSRKYGNFNYIKEKKDPIIDDLVSSSKCYPIRLGIHEIDVYWDTKEYRIILSLIGDHDGFYLEISYIHKNRDKVRTKTQIKKVIKKF